jgi:hypothetical protein
VGKVKQADLFAYALDFFQDRAVLHGHVPTAEFHHARAEAFMDCV